MFWYAVVMRILPESLGLTTEELRGVYTRSAALGSGSYTHTGAATIHAIMASPRAARGFARPNNLCALFESLFPSLPSHPTRPCDKAVHGCVVHTQDEGRSGPSSAPTQWCEEIAAGSDCCDRPACADSVYTRNNGRARRAAMAGAPARRGRHGVLHLAAALAPLGPSQGRRGPGASGQAGQQEAYSGRHRQRQAAEGTAAKPSDSEAASGAASAQAELRIADSAAARPHTETGPGLAARAGLPPVLSPPTADCA